MALDIAAGTSLNFAPDAYLIVQGANLTARGTAQAPILLNGIGQNLWKGPYVLESPAPSPLSHVTIGATDGLDTSGSDVVARNVTFSHIGDKAISAGEKSRVSIDGALITQISTGIVSKDGSQVVARAVDVSEFELFAAMAYKKKSIYGDASLSIEASAFDQTMMFNQLGNTLTLDELIIPGQDLDVDALYAQGTMQKVQ
jgi:hypothetical protein